MEHSHETERRDTVAGQLGLGRWEHQNRAGAVQKFRGPGRLGWVGWRTRRRIAAAVLVKGKRRGGAGWLGDGSAVGAGMSMGRCDRNDRGVVV